MQIIYLKIFFSFNQIEGIIVVLRIDISKLGFKLMGV